MHCPDQPGIISVITDFITTNRGNIIYLDQYVDRVNGIFYMRIEWDLENFMIPTEKIDEYFNTLYAARYEMFYRLSFSTRKAKNGYIREQDVALSLRYARTLCGRGMGCGDPCYHKQSPRPRHCREAVRHTFRAYSRDTRKQGRNGAARI